VSHHHHPHHEHNNHHNPEGMTHDDFGLVTQEFVLGAVNTAAPSVVPVALPVSVEPAQTPADWTPGLGGLVDDFVHIKTHDDFGLVTEDEFADAMNVGKMTVAKWRKDGTGPAYTMVGKSVYYQTKNVYAWLDWRTFLSGKSPDEPGARAAA